MSELYFDKCTHFLLFLSLSAVPIHQFHSCTKILTLISLIPTTNSPHSHPYSPYSHHYSLHSHPDSPHSHSDSPHSHIPLIPFPDSPFRLLQIAPLVNRNTHKKTTVLDSLFNKVAGFQAWTLLKKDSNIGIFL